MKAQASDRQKRLSAGRQPKRSRRAYPRRNAAATRRTIHAAIEPALIDEQWLQRMRRLIRTISRQIDELELIFRALEALESKQAVRRWFNSVIPALGARPIDLCQTASGRRAVLRELGRIEHGVHS